MYPIDTNGSVNVAAISGNNVSLLCNKLIDMNLDSINDKVINIIFNIIIIIIEFDITDFDLFPELISLLMAS
jgi:hypothetical protein